MTVSEIGVAATVYLIVGLVCLVLLALLDAITIEPYSTPIFTERTWQVLRSLSFGRSSW